MYYKLIIIDQVWDKFYNIHTHEDNYCFGALFKHYNQ